jgi:hypothetical protein
LIAYTCRPVQRRQATTSPRGVSIATGIGSTWSALLGLVAAHAAPAGDPALMGTLRSLNCLTGGTLHVASLGVFIGSASLAARRVTALPGWIGWLGLIQAVVAVLSLLSVFVYYAALLILIGRLHGFVWCIGVAVVLAVGGRSASRMDTAWAS